MDYVIIAFDREEEQISRQYTPDKVEHIFIEKDS